MGCGRSALVGFDNQRLGQIKLRAKHQTVWLTQREMPRLIDVITDNVGLHLKNIFADAELEPSSVTE
ncbi:hypothetical protein [Aquitalea sp. ASV11]|uniref:hypothetical protein n=1 Tax=Aquitalea sp. ASV11 TaxID=2795103 RepID=UPI0018EDD08B|nr:hypothetical protein [Aquitalea sp. ASV11]